MLTRPFLALLMATGLIQQALAEVLPAAGSELRIEWRGQFDREEMGNLRRWLLHASETTAALYGELPRDQLRVVIQRAEGAGEPVPYAHVIRSHPQGVKFYVNPAFSLGRFMQDWTAAHEFSHLYLPYPGQPDIWLSEGLATYYQNLLRARVGVLTERQAWQKLVEGFQRGRSDKRYNHLSLNEVSADMRGTRSYMRVYWSGTAYFLEADLLLRQRSGNRQSLDSVLMDYASCCLDSAGETTGEELVTALDRVAGSTLFSRLYRRYARSHGMPETGELLRRLGIEPTGDGVRMAAASDRISAIRSGMMNASSAAQVAAVQTARRQWSPERPGPGP